MNTGDDIVVFHADGADSYFKDYLSRGKRAPFLEDKQNLLDHPDHNVEVDDSNQLVTVFARRALDTGDSLDYVIQLDKEFNLGYAYNSKSTEISTIHEVQGTIPVTLNSDGSPLWGSMPTSNGDDGSESNDETSETEDPLKSSENRDSAFALTMPCLTFVVPASIAFLL